MVRGVIKLQIDYKLQDKFDLAIFLPACFLIIGGLLAIYSSTVHHPTASGNFQRQLIWAIISLLVFFIIYSLPLQTFKMFSVAIYIVTILLLVATLLVGKTVNGDRKSTRLNSRHANI